MGMAPMPAGRDSRGGRMELNVTLVRRAEKLGFREKQGIQRVDLLYRGCIVSGGHRSRKRYSTEHRNVPSMSFRMG